MMGRLQRLAARWLRRQGWVVFRPATGKRRCAIHPSRRRGCLLELYEAEADR